MQFKIYVSVKSVTNIFVCNKDSNFHSIIHSTLINPTIKTIAVILV
jgi:hypothetical protein